MADDQQPLRVTASLEIDERFERLLALNADDVASIFPNQIEAIKRLALLAQNRWIEYASGSRDLPGGGRIRRWTGAYAQSIQIEQDGDLRYIIFSDSPYAHILEEGARSWDMKKLLYTSHKARMTADGKRYIIWPFRHGTPGTTVVGEYSGREMPVPVHQWWLARDRATWSSRVTDTYEEESIQDGETTVTRRRYHWGDRLTSKSVADLGLDPEEEGRRFVGMVRFDHPAGRHGQYVTFRVMTEDSSGWIVPARDGKYPARSALEFIMKHADTVLEAALQADIQRLLDESGA